MHFSKLVDKIAFGAYNTKFINEKDGCSWLTKDEEIRRLYKEDKLGDNTFKFDSVFYKNIYGIPCNKNTAEAFGYEEGTLFKCRPYLQMRCADGTHQMWTASQSDILADDWYVVGFKTSKFMDAFEKFDVDSKMYRVAWPHYEYIYLGENLELMLKSDKETKLYSPTMSDILADDWILE